LADSTDRPNRNALLVDARALASFLIDMPPEWQRRGLLSRRPGFDDVLYEVHRNQEVLGERAGITSRDYRELCTDEEQHQQIQALLPVARKVLELLEENAARLDDRIQRRIKGLSAAIEIRAGAFDDRELLGPYENTLAYRSAPQVKGARTRRRNRAAAEAQAQASAQSQGGRDCNE
jgi:hypothetical protein